MGDSTLGNIYLTLSCKALFGNIICSILGRKSLDWNTGIVISQGLILEKVFDLLVKKINKLKKITKLLIKRMKKLDFEQMEALHGGSILDGLCFSVTTASTGLVIYMAAASVATGGGWALVLGGAVAFCSVRAAFEINK